MSKRSRRRKQGNKPPLTWIKRAGASPPKITVEDELLTQDTFGNIKSAGALYDVLGDALGDRGAATLLNPNLTHSKGVLMNPSKGSIAKQLLLNRPREREIGMDETVHLKGGEKFIVRPKNDDRPLIDKVQNATFTDSVGLQYIEDKYAFRQILRKAHCFTLDAGTSSLAADFSIAVAQDLDAARRLALPPFPVTWFDVDNRARLNRMKELGVQLTKTAQGDDVVERVGWLIHPAHDIHLQGHYLTYCVEVGQGVLIAPLSFFWHTGPAESDGKQKHSDEEYELMERLAFGVKNSGVGIYDAFPATTPFSINTDKLGPNARKQVNELMLEISGELRTLFGLLIALGAGHLGAVSTISDQRKPSVAPFQQKGKTLLPLEHKVLTITLSKRTNANKIAAKAIFHAHKRWHEVRGHWRELKNPDGTVRKRVPVKAHERGDKHLGVVEKTYLVQK